MTNPLSFESWKIFDRIFNCYDRINRILSFGMDRSWRNKTALYLPFQKDLKLLDLATGTGNQVLAFLNSKASIKSITGIDLSQKMLEVAKKKFPEVNFLHADAEKLPFKDESFHAASFAFGIRNVCNPSLSLEEVFRVLKKKGRCLILEFSLPPKPICWFYLFYLRHILPRVGQFLSKDPTAYRYLNQTIEKFPCGKKFCLLLKKAGFKKVQMIFMSLGCVTLYIGEKN